MQVGQQQLVIRCLGQPLEEAHQVVAQVANGATKKAGQALERLAQWGHGLVARQLGGDEVKWVLGRFELACL